MSHVFFQEEEVDYQIEQKMGEIPAKVNCNCSRTSDKHSPFPKLIRYSEALRCLLKESV